MFPSIAHRDGGTLGAIQVEAAQYYVARFGGQLRRRILKCPVHVHAAAEAEESSPRSATDWFAAGRPVRQFSFAIACCCSVLDAEREFGRHHNRG